MADNVATKSSLAHSSAPQGLQWAALTGVLLLAWAVHHLRGMATSLFIGFSNHCSAAKAATLAMRSEIVSTYQKRTQSMDSLLNLVQTIVLVGSARGARPPFKDRVKADNSNPLRLVKQCRLLKNLEATWSSSWYAPFLQQASILSEPRSICIQEVAHGI